MSLVIPSAREVRPFLSFAMVADSSLPVKGLHRSFLLSPQGHFSVALLASGFVSLSSALSFGILDTDWYVCTKSCAFSRPVVAGRGEAAQVQRACRWQLLASMALSVRRVS